jgi:uncharacterized protein (DUF1800 family)
MLGGDQVETSMRPKPFSFVRGAITVCLLLAACGWLGGCGSGVALSVTSSIAPSVSAADSVVRVNQTLQILSEAGGGSPLRFSVDGVAGGNATLGTIDANGLYTAPAVVPSPNNTITITGVAAGSPQTPAGSLAISVLNPVPVIAGMTPSTLMEGATTIQVTGSQFVPGATVVWNGAMAATTFVSDSQLVATITAPKSGTFPLTVTNPNPGSASASSVAEVVVPPANIVLTFLTNQATSVRVTNSLSVELSVSGTSNTGVNWLINGMANGNAQIGTIVGNPDGSATYTAPGVVPLPSNVVQITAVSQDNTAISATQNISVMNPVPVLQSGAPAAFNPGPATLVLTGSNFAQGAQVLVNGSAVQTQFNSAGQLTASFNAVDPGNLDVQVANPAPGAAASADLIVQVNGTQPSALVSPADASRFLAQATFGATDSDIRFVAKAGFQAWLNAQFQIPQILQEPTVDQQLQLNHPPCATGDLACNVSLFVQNSSDAHLVQQGFWQQALDGTDQLRQRVTYALTEMLVISDVTAAVQVMPRSEAAYYDILGADAFGNFRTLLEDVTLSPAMGQFLSMLGNDKGTASTDPDENYAREVMQLFTIGLYQLNQDGTQKLDSMGNPIPTYSNQDVMGIAKVFTGFSWNIPGDTSDAAWSNGYAYVGPGFGEDLLPMQSFPNHHSINEKNFLGVTIPASSNADPVGDLKTALDTLFNHPNLPPFFSKQMIQHLVTSNPSPAYVSRVAAVFKDNGSGVRGDMKAVLQAILLDDEARNTTAAAANPQFGKVREALLRFTEWARAFTAQSRGGVFLMASPEDPMSGLGEMSLRAPTVFNWFAPTYTPPGTSIESAGLLAPEEGMTDVSTVVGYLNFMQSAIDASVTNGPDIYSNYSAEIALAANAEALLDRVNLLLMADAMNATLRSQILAAVNAIAIPAGDAAAIQAALTARVKTAIYLTMASPAFAAQI